MTVPAAVLMLAWIAAVLGPVVCALLVRLLLRRGQTLPAWGLAAGTALFWGLGVWAFLVEPATLTVRRVTVESPSWRGPPLRIGVISDTHVAAPHMNVRRMQRVIGRMNAEQPDIVLLLGDYTGGHERASRRRRPERSEVLRGVEVFGELTAPLGAYGVLGNHDSWFDNLAIEAALARGEVRALENAAARVARPSGAFWIAGIADMQSPRQPPQVDRALSDVKDGAPVIAISHWPDPFVDIPGSVALMLAGHTHCGQVNLPLLGRLAHASPMSEQWPCGLYDEGGRKLFVTGGVGVSILPVRFRAPPEIVIVTLRAPAGDRP